MATHEREHLDRALEIFEKVKDSGRPARDRSAGLPADGQS
jgi:hypothetical protein